jgi:hypothetical protein
MSSQPFTPSPYLSSEVNDAIGESELAGGAYIDKLPVGKTLKVRTRNRVYFIDRVAEGREGLKISGHPRYCPEPTPAYILGSTFGGSMLKIEFVGRGMHLEFSFYEDNNINPGTITTSQIQEVTEL